MTRQRGAAEAEPVALPLSYWPADTSEPVLDWTVGRLLREAAAADPDGVALVEGVPDPDSRRRFTFAELNDIAEQVARRLLRYFEPGERLAVWAPNLPEWVFVELGAALAGLTLVTVNPAYRSSELEYVLGQSRASGLFLVRDYRGQSMAAALTEARPRLERLRHVFFFDEWREFMSGAPVTGELPEVSPDAAVQIQYTSGTTGVPKGALLHHRGMVNNARLVARRGRLGKVWVNAVPLFHSSGGGLAIFGPLFETATVVLVEQFDPGLILELIESERVTFLPGVPTMLIKIIEHPDFRRRDLSSLTSVCSGGTSVPPELVRRIEESLGVSFSISYGQTEASPGVTQNFPDDSIEDKALTAGPPLPQTEVKIVDRETGEVLPLGEPGELCTRGYLVMHGYFDMPEATAAAIDEEGWLHTGDVGSMDERGYCRIHGRLKEMIIRGGENIYPREIEELLFEHPQVADVAVVGLPDERWGEIVGAFVRDADPSNPASDGELHTYCRENLSPQKTPKAWYRVDEFPLTPSGKIQKFVLVEEWKKGAHSAA